jgi:uncharacterized membrane protein YgcG
MMAMMISTVIVMASVILFGLWYTQHTLTTTEHRTSIDSAALAAASAVGRIVIQTPEMGYVSLTGAPPVGTASVMRAPDNWIDRVHSINELMGTARLNLIIADEIGDPVMRKLALNYRDDVIAAKNKLIAAVEAAITPTGSGLDIDGNTVTPYKEAERLYLSNPTLASSYVPNSLRLTLGTVEGGVATAIHIPVPTSMSQVSPGDATNDMYMSDRNIQAGGVDFVFAPITKQPALVQHRKFLATSPASIQMPGAVEVYAEQTFDEQGRKTKVPYSSVATAGGIFVSPQDGELRINFPDGRPNECTTVKAMLDWAGMSKDTAVFTAQGGDYPKGGGTLDTTVPWKPLPLSSPPTASEIAKLAIFDWLTNAGSRPRVDVVKEWWTDNFEDVKPPKEKWVSVDKANKKVEVDNVPNGNSHQYYFNSGGYMVYKWKRMVPEPYFSVAHNQLYAETMDVPSTTNAWPGSININLDGVTKTVLPKQMYDFYLRDYVRYRGDRTSKHSGEPMVWQGDYGTSGMGAAGWYGDGRDPGLPPTLSQQTDFALSTKPEPVYKQYMTGPSGGAPRISYTEDGICAEIRFRLQLNVTDPGSGILVKGYKGKTIDPSLAPPPPPGPFPPPPPPAKPGSAGSGSKSKGGSWGGGGGSGGGGSKKKGGSKGSGGS